MSKITRILILVVYLLCNVMGFAVSTNNPVHPKHATTKKSPGNKLFIGIPSDGLPAVVTVCNNLTFKANVSNLQAVDQADVTLEVKFPKGIIPNANGVTVNGILASFTTPLPAKPNEIVVNIGTIVANSGPATGNALVETIATATCEYFTYATNGGSSRVFYNALYPGDSDILKIVGNPDGFTIEFNPSLPALNILGTTTAPPNVTLGSTVTRVVELINGGSGGLNNFDFFVTNGTDLVFNSIAGATINSQTPTSLNCSVSTAQILANTSPTSDGDGIFELNERYYITLSYTVASCAANQNSFVYRAAWGCSPGVYCDDDIRNDGVVFGNIVPNITVVADDTNPLYQNQKCFGENYHRILKLTNTGNGVSTNGTFKVGCVWY